MSKILEFTVNEQVVYPSHGVGIIKAIEHQSVGGFDLQFYVIEFEKDKMILKVPVGRAEVSGLRSLSKDAAIDKAMETLKSRAKAGRGMWSRRAQEYEAKINSGDIILIAEVVRDLHKNVDDPDRSYSERVIYEAALKRLAGEYAAVKTVSIEEATDNIVKLLKVHKSRSTKKAKVEEVETTPAPQEEEGIALTFGDDFIEEAA